MNQLKTVGIVLTRTDYGEADRIITVLTPDVGKQTLMAKGVRRVKSKLAGGIELFSVSELTYVRGRGNMGTLVSARLQRHYGHIVSDINRTMAGYELIKLLHIVTEDEVEDSYFVLLEQAIAALDNDMISPDFIQSWFNAQLLRRAGLSPNLTHTSTGDKLLATERYDFDCERACFLKAREGVGMFDVNTIKFIRLLFGDTTPRSIARITGASELVATVKPMLSTLRTFHLGH